jgi:hypothetical protein
MEYLVPFPFHASDSGAWPPLEFTSNGVPLTVRRPYGSIEKHATSIQSGNEEADAYCTVVRVSHPNKFNFHPDEGWKIVRLLLAWIRVKCRHYWLLHGINGFGAAYRGTLFSRQGTRITYQNLAMYGPNVIVNPLTPDLWMTMKNEMAAASDPPIEDGLFCDALLSIVAGDLMKALLEAGVAAEVALTKLLVEVSQSHPVTSAKRDFTNNGGDRHSFGKKLSEWTRKLGLEPVDRFLFPNMNQDWSRQVGELYKLRNGVAHGGNNPGANHNEVVGLMFAANTLLEYCRIQRLHQDLPTFTMPPGTSPAHQIRMCHDACISTSSSEVVADLNA